MKSNIKNFLKISLYIIFALIISILVIYLINKLMLQGKDNTLLEINNLQKFKIHDNTSSTIKLVNKEDNNSEEIIQTTNNIEITGNYKGVDFKDEKSDIKNKLIKSINTISKDFHKETKNTISNIKVSYQTNDKESLVFTIRGINKSNNESFITYNENLVKEGPYLLDYPKMIEMGNFTNNIKNGRYIAYYKNKYIESGLYNSNIKQGNFTRFNMEIENKNDIKYSNISDSNYLYIQNINNNNFKDIKFKETLIAKGTYSLNALTGIYSEYFPSGKIKSLSSYELGIKDGQFTYYYENGKVYSEGKYTSNKKHGPFLFYKYINNKKTVYAEIVYKYNIVEKAVCKTNNEKISIKINNPESIELNSPMNFCKI